MSYDSTKDTKAHIEIVQRNMGKLIDALYARSEHHDASKFENPELDCYNKYVPMLKKAKYGSKEYEEIRDKMAEEGLNHHYSENRHHPEHFENGVNDMTLVDLIEMFVDWFSASKRSDTPFDKSIGYNVNKFKLSPQLTDIFINTYREYFATNYKK